MPKAKSRTICGIYYLWDGAEVLYVGKSTNIRKRIWKHRNDRLDFAGYFVDECEPHELFEREAKAISEFKPPYNVAMNLNHPMKPLIGVALLSASYIYISAAVFGLPRGTVHRQASDTAVPPRLFLNGEVAQVRATYQRVVVQSARWDTRCKCYQYTVTPYEK